MRKKLFLIIGAIVIIFSLALENNQLVSAKNCHSRSSRVIKKSTNKHKRIRYVKKISHKRNRKSHTIAFSMPRKFWGTWYNGNVWMKITKRHIIQQGNNALTYKAPRNVNNLPYNLKKYYIRKHGNLLKVYVPQLDGFSLKIKNGKLIYYGNGGMIKYHH